MRLRSVVVPSLMAASGLGCLCESGSWRPVPSARSRGHGFAFVLTAEDASGSVEQPVGQVSGFGFGEWAGQSEQPDPAQQYPPAPEVSVVSSARGPPSPSTVAADAFRESRIPDTHPRPRCGPYTSRALRRAGWLARRSRLRYASHPRRCGRSGGVLPSPDPGRAGAAVRSETNPTRTRTISRCSN